MRLKVVILFFFFFLFNKYITFAYSDGLLDSSFNSYTFIGGSNIPRMFDNSVTTFGGLSTNELVKFKLNKTYDVNKIYLLSSNSRLNYAISFYNSSGNLITTLSTLSMSKDGDWYSFNTVSNVLYVSLKSPDVTNIYEFDIYAPYVDNTAPNAPKNLRGAAGEGYILLKWDENTENDLKGYNIYQSMDNIFFQKITGNTVDSTSYTVNGLTNGQMYYFAVTAVDINGNESVRSQSIVAIPIGIPPAEVMNLSAITTDTTLRLTFSNPADADFAGTKIYLDGVLKETLDKTKTSYSLTDLSPNTTYNIKVTTFDTNGNESDGVTTTVKTKIPIVNDVTDLQADAKYDRVKLSWTKPNSEFFHHVKIYRKKIEQKSFWDQLFGTTAVSAVTTSDGYTPMFETNGTYWTDLTVTPETTYSYKVTSVNIEGNESQGVTIETTTPSEPVPVLTGVATTQNEDGDYVVTWTSPTKGTVKLLIEGREYAQVDAATKQIIVRKEDMKTDFFGSYAATLIPIGEYGTKGQAVNVPSLGGKIDFPLSFQDFMETVVSILAWVAPFIILSLVFIFWRPIFNFIKKAISERRVKQ